MLFGMSLINSFTHIQENWKFVIICVQNQWGVVHTWHGTVANLWGRHKDFTEFNENFEKSYLLNGLSNIVKFVTVWFLKIFCIKWIHIFFWVQCSFNKILYRYIGETGLVVTRASCYSWIAFSQKLEDSRSSRLYRMKNISNQLCMQNLEIILYRNKKKLRPKNLFLPLRVNFWHFR